MVQAGRLLAVYTAPSVLRRLPWRKLAMTVSAIVLVIGLLNVGSRGENVLGLDLSGGMSMSFTAEQPIDAETIKAAIADVDNNDAVVSCKTAAGQHRQDC